MSRADRFDSADFDVRYRRETVAAESTEPLTVRSASDVVKPAVTTARKQSTQAVRLIWPIAREQIKRVGESVLAVRKAKERPHKGIDLFADEGTEVLTARGGQVLRVVDGRSSTNKGLRRAGLFVDVRGADSLVYRYLHLGEARVEAGASVKQGTVLGIVAAARTSGLADEPHLHFEVREADYSRQTQDYGAPVDPLRLLPPFRA